MLNLLFSFEGRIGRLAYLSILFCIAFSYAFIGKLLLYWVEVPHDTRKVVFLFMIIYTFVCLCVFLTATVKRFKDLEFKRTGYTINDIFDVAAITVIFTIIPFLLILPLFYLLLKKGNQKDNYSET
jgi:uncharacterized membrane protein YhaH (DUF805 family)